VWQAHNEFYKIVIQADNKIIICLDTV
jgi:hypothetical protein